MSQGSSADDNDTVDLDGTRDHNGDIAYDADPGPIPDLEI